MRRRSLQSPEPSGKINVTPLIDVVMVLIVFYLIVGRLATDQGRPVTPPRTEVGLAETSAKLVITVAPGAELGGAPEIRVGEELVSAERLVGVLRALAPIPDAAPAVALRADRGLEFGAVAPVIKACREAGFKTLKLVTQKAGGGA